MREKAAITLTINGCDHPISVEPRRTLADAIREDCGQTGTHIGCEHGICGACTVIVDGEPVRSCLLLAATVDGCRLTTVEGLSGPGGEPHPVQRAFKECHGLQCGFCTPGFLTTIAAYLERSPRPSEDDAREAIAGNLCRCTGYQNIVKSVLWAAEKQRAQTPGAE